ncbi:MAG: DUF2835 domain-containing protein [Gammaproteobacteria bacterium]|nr:DUF2835 domain-containing protein [Gammaproteobacteria bacterium]
MTFSLHISPDQYQRYYQGSAKAIIVKASDGRTLRFPASALQKFVTHEGIQGAFEISFDNNNKMIGLIKIS